MGAYANRCRQVAQLADDGGAGRAGRAGRHDAAHGAPIPVQDGAGGDTVGWLLPATMALTVVVGAGMLDLAIRRRRRAHRWPAGHPLVTP